jgi:hypothetical protein
LPCPSKLHHVESEVVRLNDRGQRAALAQWEDVADSLDRTHLFSVSTTEAGSGLARAGVFGGNRVAQS